MDTNFNHQNIQEIIEQAIENYEKKHRLYTKKQLAQQLRIHPTTISRWIKQGRIKNKDFYTYNDLKEIIETN